MQRLTRREQFTRVLAAGVRIAGVRFLVRAMPNEEGVARLGIVAGRKDISRAVDRNRSKRLVREVFRASADALGAVDVVVLCRRAVAREGRFLARQELGRLFAKVGGPGSAPDNTPAREV